MKLPTADKPALACLASRIPYGSPITRAKLLTVDRMERKLRQLGFCEVRVRHHGTIARIEVGPAQIKGLCRESIRRKVIKLAKENDFLYTVVDLEGYRTGSMNEVKLKRR